MRIMSLAMAAGLSAVFAISSVVPTEAMPVTGAPHIERQASNGIEQARYKKWRHGHRWRGHRHWRGRYVHRRHWRGGYWRGGVWIGGPRIVIGVGPRHRWNRHVRWCRNHYASYRRSDNSWTSNSGVRRVCVSPYRR